MEVLGRIYKVIRLINNNVVMCYDDEDFRCMLIGKGIGFGLKAQSRIYNTEKVEKIFYLIDPENKYKFDLMTKEINVDIIGVVEESIALMEDILDKPLKESIHVTLLDHINFALNRIKNNITIKNVFVHEIKFLYTEEYLIAERVVKHINSRLNIKLPEDEAGFIAMHIHAAANDGNLRETVMANEILEDMITFIENRIGKKLDRNSLPYFRLITHLRFAIDRAIKNITLENILLDTIKDKFKESFSLAKELVEYIKENHDISFNDSEMGYIAVHLQNIVNNR